MQVTVHSNAFTNRAIVIGIQDIIVEHTSDHSMNNVHSQQAAAASSIN